MAVHRERVDPQQDSEDLGTVHRRWILPDDPSRAISGQQLARLWRGLIELSVLDGNDEVLFETVKLPLPDEEVEPDRRDIPANASAGVMLAGAQSASLLTQVVRLDQGHGHDCAAFNRWQVRFRASAWWYVTVETRYGVTLSRVK